MAYIANTKLDADDGYDEAVPANVTDAECKANLDVAGTLTSEGDVLLVDARFARVVPNGERSTAR